MLRKLLIATTLLAASGAAVAHGSYYSGDPSFAFSYSSGYPGVSVTYATGGAPYWGAYGYAPAPVVVVPPPRYRVYSVPPGHAYRYGYGPGYGSGWKGNHYRDDRRHDRHDRH